MISAKSDLAYTYFFSVESNQIKDLSDKYFIVEAENWIKFAFKTFEHKGADCQKYCKINPKQCEFFVKTDDEKCFLCNTDAAKIYSRSEKAFMYLPHELCKYYS